MEERKGGRGGRREGSGRKPKPEAERNPRPQNQVRAYPEEYELVKIFVKLVRSDINAARELLTKAEEQRHITDGKK